MINGIIVIDKPKDFTSHDVVAKVRGILRQRQIGHSGTLDPMATGVLPLFLGNATKAADRQPDHSKAYLATLKLGLTTDTQDITGQILTQNEVNVNKDQVFAAAKLFIGETIQTPPIYSAISVGGRRLYDIARAGEKVDIPKRKITIESINFVDWNEKNSTYTFEIYCSKGTYIRAVCSDMGQKLGCGGTLSELRRIKSGVFYEKDAITIKELEKMASVGQFTDKVIPVEKVFDEYQKIVLSDELCNHFNNGVPLWLSQLEINDMPDELRFYSTDGKFIGVAGVDYEKNQITRQKQFRG